MRTKPPRFRPLSFIAIPALALALAGCQPSPDGGADGRSEVLRAIPGEAELVVYFDQEAISDSTFVETVESMQEDMPESQTTTEMGDRLTEITGLEDEDITQFAMAVSGLESFDTDPTLAKISGALFAVKPVSAEQVVEAIEYMASQNDETVELKLTVGEGADYIEFPKEEDAPEMYAAIVTGDSSTTAFFGDRDSVEAALARDSGSVPEKLKAPSEGLVEGQQGWVSFILPQSFKDQLPGLVAQGEQMAPGVSKISSLQSVGVGVRAEDAMRIAIGMNLGSPEDAETITGVLNNQLISFAKMMLAGNSPEPLPLLESLAASQSGDRSVLSLSITPKDIELLQAQLLNLIPAAMGQGAGSAVPPAPPSAN